VGLLLFVAATFYLIVRDSRNEQEWVALSTDVQVVSQQLAKSASEAASGVFDAFFSLGDARSIIEDDMKMLRDGDPLQRLPAVPSSVEDELLVVDELWQEINTNALAVIERESKVLELADASERFINLIPQVQALTDQAMRELTQNNAPSQQIFVAGRLLVVSDRILRHLRAILDGGQTAVTAEVQFEQEIRFFDDMLDALLRGSQSIGVSQVRNAQALNYLGQVRQAVLDARPDIDLLLGGSSDLLQVRAAADEILIDSQAIFDHGRTLTQQLQSRSQGRIWPSLGSGVVALLISFGIITYLVYSFLTAERRRATFAGAQNQRNQAAILRLLDEMSALAEGDLTVKATVSDDVTGAIADSVNYTVEQLREVVEGINTTAMTVFDSAEETKQRTTSLAESSGRQATQVRAITKTINKMAGAFDDMAKRSRQSNDVARRSVEHASKGSEMVQQTIAGMDKIRDQIQDTSKRIKRLGESSQEIGDIVELINGIAEQTNILALNAAIQSASAGGAGRGFAVVADEVQRLAERATNATRRIELLVQTIQADTSEAIASMESTTAEVVSGAKKSEDAGEALGKIETVSKDLSDLIDEIATAAQKQSEVATQVAGEMNAILDIAIKTSEGSNQTAQSMGALREQVARLSESVADFKLPDQSF
jgi:twitching motility protein PilJ